MRVYVAGPYTKGDVGANVRVAVLAADELLAPSPDRADLRSETPRGFARAVFEHMTANECAA